MSPAQIKAGWRLVIIYVVIGTVGLVMLLTSARPNRTNTEQPQDLSHTTVEYHSTCIECGETP